MNPRNTCTQAPGVIDTQRGVVSGAMQPCGEPSFLTHWEAPGKQAIARSLFNSTGRQRSPLRERQPFYLHVRVLWCN